MKKIYALAAMICLLVILFFAGSVHVQAQILNPGFEASASTLTNWSGAGGSVSTGTTISCGGNNWVIQPADTRMAFLTPGGYANSSATETALSLSAGSLGWASVTNFSAIYQDISLSSGASVTFWWNYVSEDYSPYDDGCFASIKGPGGQQVQPLARTVTTSGCLVTATGSYGSSGWHTVTFTVSTAGTYRLGFGVFNWGDQSVQPHLFVDDGAGGTVTPGDPVLNTNAVTSITGTSATSGGNITSAGSGASSITARGICWGTSPQPTTNATSASPATGTGSYSVNMTGLSPGVHYYVRAYATNNLGRTAYGGDVDFTTPSSSAPTVSTTSVTGVTSTSANTGGNVTSDGGATVTARGVCYNTSGNPTISDPKVVNGSGGTGSFTSALSSLSTNTTYYVKAYATNSAGTGYGSQESFKTGPNAPVASAASPVGMTSFTALWSAPSGATNYLLDISTSSDFSSFVTAGGNTYNGYSVGNYTFCAITGLTSGATYYYRVRAYNNSAYSVNSNQITVQTKVLHNFLIEAASGGNIGTQIAGQPFNIKLTARASDNTTITDFTGTATITSNSTLTSGGTTASFVGGVLSSHSVTLTQAGTLKTLTATNGISSTSNTFTVLPADINHWTLVANGPITAGVEFTVTATVYDIYGNVKTNYIGDHSVSWTTTAISSPNNTPRKIPADGNQTFVAGQATIGGFFFYNADPVASGSSLPTITITDGPSSVAGTTEPITVNNNILNSFLVTAGTLQNAGVPFDVTVKARDAYWNIVKDYGGTIRFKSSNDLLVSYPANYTFLPADQGIHVFTSGINIGTSGEYWVRVADETFFYKSGQQDGIVVAPGAFDPANSEFIVDGTVKTAGELVYGTLIPRDAFGNLLCPGTHNNSPLNVKLDGSNKVYGNQEIEETDALDTDGKATGSYTANVLVTSTTATNHITAYWNGVPFLQSYFITVSPAGVDLDHTTIVADKSTMTIDQTSMVTVQLKDMYDNNRNAYDGTVVLTTVPPSLGTLSDGTSTSKTLTAIYNGGTTGAYHLTFLVTENGLGTATISGTLDGEGIADQAEIVLTHGAATHLAIFTQPPSTSIAGVVFNPEPVIYIRDQFDNLVTTGADASRSIGVSKTAGSGTGTILGTTSVSAVNGIATFTDLNIQIVGSYWLDFTSTGLTHIESDEVDIYHADADHLAIHTWPSSGIAGQVFNPAPVIWILDAFENHVNDGPTSTGDIAMTKNSGPGTITGTATIVAVGGIATFGDLMTTTSGTYTLDFTKTGITHVISPEIVILPASPTHHLTISDVTSVIAGELASYTVTRKDIFGNNTSTGDQEISLSSNSAGNHKFFLPDGVTEVSSVTIPDGASTASFRYYDEKASTATSVTVQAQYIIEASDVLAVLHASADHLTITTQPSAMATAGVIFTQQPVLEVRDEFQNILDDLNSTLIVTKNAGSTGSGPLSGTTTIPVINGEASCSDLYLTISGIYALDFAYDALPVATSENIQLGHAAADHLTIIQQPPSSTTAGTAFTPDLTVEVRDQFQNIVLDASGTFSVDKDVTSTGTGSLFGGSTPSPVNGIATFSGLNFRKVGDYYLRFNFGSMHVVSEMITIIHNTPDHLTITQQPPATTTAGTEFTPDLTVEIRDFYENLINDAAGNMPVAKDASSTGSGNLFGSSSPAPVNGIVTFAGLNFRTVGDYYLKFTYEGLEVLSDKVTIIHNIPDHLAISQQPPATSVAGSAFTPDLTVEILDFYNNLITDAAGNMTVSRDASSTGAGALFGTVSQAPVNGIATFNGLNFQTVGDYYLLFTYDLFTVKSSKITIIHDAEHHLVVGQQPPVSEIAGIAFTPAVTVTIFDQFENVISDATGAIQVSKDGSSTGTGSLFGTTSQAPVDGIATFPGLNFHIVGDYFLLFTYHALDVVSSKVSILHNEPDHLIITQQPPLTALAGEAFIPSVAVEIRDLFENIIDDAAGNMTVTKDASSTGTGSLFGGTPESPVSGIATFPDLNFQIAGNYALRFIYSGMEVLSDVVTITHNSATHIAIHTQPQSVVTAGYPFAPQPVIYMLDAYDNLVNTGLDATGAITVIKHGSSTGSGPLLGTLTANASGGIASFTDLHINKSGVYYLGFSYGAFSQVVSTSVTIVPDVANYYTLNAPSDITAGNRAAYVVTRYDQYDNAVLAGAQIVYLTSNSTGANKKFYNVGTGGTPLVSPAYIYIANGNSSGNFWYYDEKSSFYGPDGNQVNGEWTITVSDNSPANGNSGIIDDSDNIRVLPSSLASNPNSFEMTGLEGAHYYGDTYTVTVKAKDIYGNVKTNYTGTITFSNTDLSATPPSNHTYLAGEYGVYTFTSSNLFNSISPLSPGYWWLSAISLADPLKYGGQACVVNPRPITITALDQSKIFGEMIDLGTTQFTVTSALTPILRTGELITNVTMTSDGTPASADAGIYPIVTAGATGSGGFVASNYNITYSTAGNLTVTQKGITITANNRSKTYGEELTLGTTEFTVTASNYTPGTVSSVTLTSPGAAAYAHAGSYPVIPTNASGVGFNPDNYNITYVNGELTVDPRVIHMTFDASNKVYDRTTDVESGISSDIISGDDIDLDWDAAFEDFHAGINKVVYFTNIEITGGANQYDYVLESTSGTANADITPAPVVPVIVANDKCYDATNLATLSNQSVENAYSPDEVTLIVGSAAFANAAAGIDKTVTASTLSLGGASASDYYLSVVTATDLATIYSLPVPTISGDQQVCVGATNVIYSTETGQHDYLWNLSGGGTITSGEGTSSIGVTWNAPGDYQVSVIYTDDNNCTASPAITYNVHVNNEFIAGTISENQTQCYGETPSLLSGIAPTGGQTPYTYQWESSASGGYSDISGATDLTYQPGSLFETVSFRLKQTSSDGCGTVTTNSVTITVYDQLVAGESGNSQSICNGQSPQILNALPPEGGSGTFAYQWQVKTGPDWENIEGGTDLNYLPGTLVATQTYRLIQTDSYCSPDQSVVSNEIVITVFDELVAGNAGSDQTICYGETPAMIGADSPSGGSETFSYQWQSNTSGDWMDIDGATDQAYSPGALYTSTAYRLIQTDAYCTPYQHVITNTVSITVHPQLFAGTASEEQTICYGESPEAISAGLPAGGSGSFSYQWQSMTTGDWENIPGATDMEYAPGALNAITSYRLVQTDTYCQPDQVVATNAVTITVHDELIAGSVSGNQTLCNGETPSMLSADAPSGGSGNFSYQWQIKAGNEWSNISGATELTYGPGPLTSSQTYRMVQTDVFCTPDDVVVTSEITVDVYTALAEGIAGIDQTVCYNETPAPIGADAPTGGSGTFGYQWQSWATGSWEDVAGATDLSYAPGALKTSMQYRLIQTDTYCSPDQAVVTNTVTITVYPMLLAGTAGSDQTICYGETPDALTAEAPTGGSNSFSYQWQTMTTGDWEDVAGAQGLEYAAGALFTTTYYRLLQTDIYCLPDQVVSSNTVTISVYNQLTAGSIGTSQTLCNGEAPALLSASQPLGGSGTFSYQWQVKDGSDWDNITGATDLDYSPGPLTLTQTYRLMQTDLYCTPHDQVVTGEVTITIYDVLVAGSAGDGQTICYGETPSAIGMNAPTGGSGTFGYQWQSMTTLDWENIPGATDLMYNPGALTVTTLFRQIQTDNYCNPDQEVITNTVTIVVYGELFAGNAGEAQVICNGQAANTLIAIAPTGGSALFSYQWQMQTTGIWADISGATELSYEPGILTETTAYRLQQKDLYCSPDQTVYTGEIVITVKPILPVSVTVDYTPDPVYMNDDVTFTAHPVNEGLAPVYQWKVNNVNAGSNSTVFTYRPEEGDIITCTLTSSEQCTSGNPATSTPQTIHFVTGPNTLLPELEACKGHIIEVPVTVSSFEDIGAVSLTLTYNSTALTYIDIVNNSGFPGLFAVGTTPGIVTVGGFTDPGVGFNLNDGEVLFTYRFMYNSGTSALNWSDNGASCEYQKSNGKPLYDLPFDSFYQNGFIDEIPEVGLVTFTAGSSSERCQSEESVTYSASAANTTGIIYSLDATSLANNNTIDPDNGVVEWASGWYGTSVVTAYADGCNPRSATHTITVHPTPSAYATESQQITCYNGTGEITITATGGTGDITYTLGSIVQVNNGVFTGMPAGNYIWIVQDVNGCGVSGEIELSQPAPIPVTGSIVYNNLAKTKLNAITVKLKQGSNVMYTATTDALGTYTLDNVCEGTYQVEFVTSKPMGGVNAGDAALANYYGLNPSQIDMVTYNAGDFQTSFNLINATDAGAILRYFVTLYSPENVSPRGKWTFWHTGETIQQINTEPKYPTPSPTFELPAISVYDGCGPFNFYGLVEGDFNRSFTPGTGGKSSSENIRLEYTGDVKAVEETITEMPVYAGQPMEVGAISLIMEFSSSQAEITGVTLGRDNTPVEYAVYGNELRIGWTSLNPLILQKGDKLLNLKVKVKGTLRDGEVIRFTIAEDPLNELADAQNHVIPEALLTMHTISSVLGVANPEAAGLLTISNYPNPFNGATTIQFTLPVDGKVTLELFDMLGSMQGILMNHELKKAGEHSILLNDSRLKPGVYIMTLTFESERESTIQTLKIVKN